MRKFFTLLGLGVVIRAEQAGTGVAESTGPATGQEKSQNAFAEIGKSLKKLVEDQLWKTSLTP